LAWSAGKAKALNFANSSKKLSRKDEFAAGYWFVKDSHSWALPLGAPVSEPGRALCVGGGAGLLEANFEMSRNYEVKK
jgi:hypothetical protein